MQIISNFAFVKPNIQQHNANHMKKILTLLTVALAAVSASHAEPVVQNVKLRLYDFNGTVKMCDNCSSDLIYEDGVYTIENFLNSYVPLSFMYDKEEKKTTFCGDNYYLPYDDEENGWDTTYGSIYDDLTDEEAECVLYNFEGEEETVLYAPEFYLPYCGVIVPSAERPYLQMSMYLYTDLDYEGYTDWLTLFMNFDLVEDDSAVEGIPGENAAPAYYNLQGVRVANPENGLFIMRHGIKAEKVIL